MNDKVVEKIYFILEKLFIFDSDFIVLIKDKINSLSESKLNDLAELLLESWKFQNEKVKLIRKDKGEKINEIIKEKAIDFQKQDLDKINLIKNQISNL